MDTMHFFNERGIFAEDDDFLLRKPMEADKEAYLSLFAEVTNIPNMYEDENLRDIPWRTALKKDLEIFIINKENNELCGDISLKNYTSKTPEIGIDLFKKYQNQGIGYRVVKLLMETTCNIHKVEFFIVRIYSDNLHSQNLFKKFGATPIDKEDSEFTVLLNSIKKYVNGDEMKKIFEKYNAGYNSDRFIIRYRIDIPA